MVKKTKKKVISNAARRFAETVLNTTALLRRTAISKILNPGKDINSECGYPDIVSVADMRTMYDRSDVSARVVKIEPEESWSNVPDIYETEDTNETPWEKLWKELNNKHNFLHYLERVDILSGIGHYGILLFGINDGKELSEPVDGVDLMTGSISGNNKYELLYIRPFAESNVTVASKEVDDKSPRYGFPMIYDIEFEETNDSNNKTVTRKVHWTRVLHVADNRDDSEVYGVPRMENVYNRLLDLRKVLSGSAEMFWKGGFPGYSFEVHPELGDAEIDVDGLQEQMEDYSAGLQRYLAISGVSAKSLAMQVADPKGHLESQLKAIAITKGIPYRIFLGSEQAQLASKQDLHSWDRRVARRQNQYLTPLVIRPFIDRLTAYGVLPEMDEFMVVWPDRETPSDIEKTEVAKGITEAMAKYVGGNVAALISPKDFLTMVLEFTNDEAATIEQGVGDYEALLNPEEEEPESVEGKVQPKKGTNV